MSMFSICTQTVHIHAKIAACTQRFAAGASASLCLFTVHVSLLADCWQGVCPYIVTSDQMETAASINHPTVD